MPTVETQVYRGVPYRRYPNAAAISDRTYFRSSGKHGKRYLHRVVYEDHWGPIPDGYHVHHRDADPANNDPWNLVAHSPSEHLSTHLRQPALRARRRQRSPEAMLARAQENLLVVEGYDLACENCGETFTCFRKQPARFCSGRCRQASWRATRHAG